jgi:uncharacterized protein YlxW (UPF0749 family)
MDINLRIGNLSMPYEQAMMYLIMAFAAMLFLLLILAISVVKLNKKYKKFMRNSSASNIEGLILEYTGKVEAIEEENEKLKGVVERIETELKNCVQKVGIVRYNAFHDTGSDLSFSLALLDNKGNGVVVSSIYGRSESITYAKPVTKGQSVYALSKEEKEALHKAMQ